MRTFLARLVTIWVLLFSQWTSAREITVYANDTGLIFGAGWQFVPDNCGGEGFAQTPNNGTVVSFIFTGTAVSVSLLKVYNSALATVFLDNKVLSGNIDLVDPLGSNAQCRREVVNSTALANTSHNITVLHAGRPPSATVQNGDWLVLIDIVYTVIDGTFSSSSVHSTPTTSGIAGTQPIAPASVNPTPSPPEPSTFKQPEVIGALVGGIFGALLLGIVISWCLFGRRRHKKGLEGSIEALPDPNSVFAPTPFYAPPLVSYPYTTGSSSHPPQGSIPTDLPSSDPRTSTVSTTNANQGFSQVGPGVVRPNPRPLSLKQGSSTPGLSADTNPMERNTSPPPPQYDFRGPAQPRYHEPL